MSELLQIHGDIDALAKELARKHAARLQCKLGCTDCCMDGLSVQAAEAERIRSNHAELLRNGTPHPEGKCAFLDDDGACRIYEDRPYVCRTQGLPLRWYDDGPDGVPAEFRDICPLNEDGPPVETLPPEDCWLLGPFELRIAELQIRYASEGGEGRVPLRGLFGRSTD